MASNTSVNLGECGVIRDPVAQIEAAEPAICQVQMHLFAQPPLRTDAEAITNQQHSDQQLGIDGGTAGVAVEICKMGTDAGQVGSVPCGGVGGRARSLRRSAARGRG